MRCVPLSLYLSPYIYIYIYELKERERERKRNAGDCATSLVAYQSFCREYNYLYAPIALASEAGGLPASTAVNKILAAVDDGTLEH